MDLRLDLVNGLRRMAAEGQKPSQMLAFMAEELGTGGEARLLAIAHFQEAFHLTLKEAAVVGAWERFPQASWSDEGMDQELGPLIARHLDL